MNESLRARVDALESERIFPSGVVERFARFVDAAPDEALFRTNPLRYAAEVGIPEAQAVELFVHATKVGILDFAWGIICPSCNMFLTTAAAMRHLDEANHCGLCQVSVTPVPDDNVEVAFTVSPAVRSIRLHADSDELSFDEAMRLAFSTSVSLAPGFNEIMEPTMMARARVAAGATGDLSFDLSPDFAYSFGAPLHHVGTVISSVSDGPTELNVELMERKVIPERIELAPGPVTLRVHNRSLRPAHMGVRRVPHELPETDHGLDPELGFAPLPYLPATRLFGSQAFRDLFRAESLPARDGLSIQSLTLLFTDLQGSTALYDRVGDLNAYGVVREHFDVLRRIVGERGGAVVKTMGDAIMASFADARTGMEAAVTMHEEAKTLGDAIVLKIGLHTGGCIAVESNERLDYFGQTVNIAARVQALAKAREVVCTEDVYETAGVAALVERAHLVPTRESVFLRGVEAATPVVRLAGA